MPFDPGFIFPRKLLRTWESAGREGLRRNGKSERAVLSMELVRVIISPSVSSSDDVWLTSTQFPKIGGGQRVMVEIL